MKNMPILHFLCIAKAMLSRSVDVLYDDIHCVFEVKQASASAAMAVKHFPENMK